MVPRSRDSIGQPHQRKRPHRRSVGRRLVELSLTAARRTRRTCGRDCPFAPRSSRTQTFNAFRTKLVWNLVLGPMRHTTTTKTAALTTMDTEMDPELALGLPSGNPRHSRLKSLSTDLARVTEDCEVLTHMILNRSGRSAQNITEFASIGVLEWREKERESCV